MEMYHKTIYIVLTFVQLIMIDEKEMANGHNLQAMLNALIT